MTSKKVGNGKSPDNFSLTLVNTISNMPVLKIAATRTEFPRATNFRLFYYDMVVIVRY